MTDDLHKRTMRGLLWSFIESAGLRGVQFVIGIVLARLLYPEHFGLIGMLTIFIAVSQSFLDSGFGAALIQKRDVTRQDICSIFYFNIAVGAAAAGLLCLAAPAVASFYGQPLVAPLLRTLSLTLVINSFGMVQSTLLAKQIDFKTTTKVSLISGALSGTLGVTLAYSGAGVWSLAAQQVAASLVSTACLWLFSSWRPNLIFSVRSLKEMFGFGSRLLLSSVLNQLFDNLYLLVIGKVFSAADLGFFTRAKTLNDLPSQTLSGMVARVTFPVFSQIHDDKVRLKRALKKALTTLVLVHFPMMIGLAVIARPLVVLLLTDRWAPSIPYLQLLCVAGLLFPLHMMNLNVLQALGRSDLFLRLEILKKLLIAVNIAVTWQWGIPAMIWGMLATSVIGYYLNSYYTGVLVRYPLREQVADLLPYLAASLVMGAVVYGAGRLHEGGLWRGLLLQIAAGIGTYLFLCRAFRLTAFMEIWQAGAASIRNANPRCIRGRT